MRTCLLSSHSPDLYALGTQEWWKKWCRSWLRMNIPYLSGLQTGITHFSPAQQSRSCSCFSFFQDAIIYHHGYVFAESCQHFTHGASHRSKLWRLIWTQQRRTWRLINERSSSSWMKFWLWFHSSSTRWGYRRGCPLCLSRTTPPRPFHRVIGGEKSSPLLRILPVEWHASHTKTRAFPGGLLFSCGSWIISGLENGEPGT